MILSEGNILVLDFCLFYSDFMDLQNPSPFGENSTVLSIVLPVQLLQAVTKW